MRQHLIHFIYYLTDDNYDRRSRPAPAIPPSHSEPCVTTPTPTPSVAMSEELEWELYDIFESGMFAFPIYEHNGARHLVRYLLLRGILVEEIADAIADSTVDLQTWLNRGGRYMVGEWVIAWINESREEYEMEKRATRGQWVRRDVTSILDWVSESNDNDSDSESVISVAAGIVDDDVEYYGALPNPLVASVRTLMDDTDEGDGENAAQVQVLPLSPLPQTDQITIDQSDTDRLKDDGQAFTANVTVSYTTPEFNNSISASADHTHKNSAKHSIPQADNANTSNPHNTSEKSTSNHLSHYKPQIDSTPVSNDPNCNGNIPSILSNGTINGNITNLSHNNATSNGKIPNGNAPVCKDIPHTLMSGRRRGNKLRCPLRIPDSIACSMPLNLETLKHDGPGYMFVMTHPTSNDGDSWAVEHRYKIASSRQPNRWLTEFHTRNVAIEIIWRVKVGRHLVAMREVYKNLAQYHVYANWFQCPLYTLVEQLSEVANKYKTSV